MNPKPPRDATGADEAKLGSMGSGRFAPATCAWAENVGRAGGRWTDRVGGVSSRLRPSAGIGTAKKSGFLGVRRNLRLDIASPSPNPNPPSNDARPALVLALRNLGHAVGALDAACNVFGWSLGEGAFQGVQIRLCVWLVDASIRATADADDAGLCLVCGCDSSDC